MDLVRLDFPEPLSAMQLLMLFMPGQDSGVLAGFMLPVVRSVYREVLNGIQSGDVATDFLKSRPLWSITMLPASCRQRKFFLAVPEVYSRIHRPANIAISVPCIKTILYHSRMLKNGSHSQVRVVEVDTGNEGQRIDNFLLGHLKGVPRSLIYRLLRTGQVRVNKGRSKPHYKLRAGDRVRIPPVRQSEPSEPVSPRTADLKRLSRQILYEDKSLIIINKPSGMAVHGGSGLSYGVIEAFRVLRPEEKFLELVHRLDRETSGCLILARKRSALVRLHEMLRRERGEKMDKTYQALVKGIWTGPKQRVNEPLLRNVRKSGERIVQVSDEGKAAVSVFVPLKNYPSADSALLEVRLLTGRTHQARVHAACIGHPIAGDDKYGDRDFNKRMRMAGLNRLFLHASRLRFRHPLEDKLIDIEAPLPDDLTTVLDNIS